MDVKLSVIVPVYNSEPYLKQCIDRILSECFCDLELILVDDGSVDGSPAIIDEYAKKDIRVRVIHQENKGQMKATLAGLEVARGRFVNMVDSDDYVTPVMHQRMIDVALSTDADLISMPGCTFYGTRVKDFCDSLNPGDYDKSRIKDYIIPNLFSNHSLYGNRGMQPSKCLKLFKRDMLLDVYASIPTDIEMGEDLLTSYTYIARCSRIVILPKGEPGYMYRGNTSSISWRYRKDLFEKSKRLCRSLRLIPNLEDNQHYQNEVDYEVCFFAINAFLNEFLMKSDRSVKQRIAESISISKDNDFCYALSRINRKEVKQPNKFLLDVLSSSNRLLIGFIGSFIRLTRSMIIKVFLTM